MTDDNEVSRRSIVKTVGAAVGSAAVVGGATLLASSPAVAASLTISDAAPVTTDTGQVSAVSVSIDHVATWDGFDIPVEAVAYTDTIYVAPSGGAEYVHTLYDNTGSPVRLEDFSSQGNGGDGWGGAGEWSTGPGTDSEVHADIDWNVLTDGGGDAKSVEDPGNINQTSIEPAADGVTKETTVRYEKTVHFYRESSDGSLVQMGGDDGTVASVTASDTFVVTVTNEEQSTSSSGSGSASVST